jgi:hypothetical protein
VQANTSDRDQEQRERQPTEVDEHDGHDRGGDRDQDACEQVRASPPALARRRAAWRLPGRGLTRRTWLL